MSLQTRRAGPLLATLGIGTLPISILAQFRDSLALDGLHLALAQLLLLVLARFWLRWFQPALPSKPPPLVVQQPTPPAIINRDASKTPTIEIDHTTDPDEFEEEHPLYSGDLLDDTLARFIAMVDPDSLHLIAQTDGRPKLQLADWRVLFEDSTVLVQAHPEAPGFYAVTGHFKGISMRHLWELLISVQVRQSYDSMTEQAEQLERIGPLGRSNARSASVDYVGLRSWFPVNAKDLVLLSVYAQLPPALTPEGKPLRRLVCASRSIEHPSKPPQPSYSRMAIATSGFLLKDDGAGGCILTQISDLSSLGSWIPAKIITMVTTKIIPKTLIKMSAAAASTPWSAERSELQGDDWLPPVINAWKGLKPPPRARRLSQQSLTASEARTLTSVESQLRVIVSRLGQLEEHVEAEEKLLSDARDVAPAQSTWLPSFLLFNWSRRRSTKRAKRGAGADLGLMLRTSFVTGLAGGAIGAALVAAAMVWARKRAR